MTIHDSQINNQNGHGTGQCKLFRSNPVSNATVDQFGCYRWNQVIFI